MGRGLNRDAWIDRLLDQGREVDAACFATCNYLEVHIYNVFGDGEDGDGEGGGWGAGCDDHGHGYHGDMVLPSSVEYGYPYGLVPAHRRTSIEGFWA